ncbi:MAG: uroporphyrinogen-III C-methyltransferase [Chloroflexi bacterium]|nr:uroporphyrinogen-III C-methyltransferase [Chloroflexota bacterium]
MTVYLVGAGPGDPGLLTMRGHQLLQTCDVLVHDRLIDPAILELASPGAERVDVGKAAGSHPVSQSQINALLVARGRAGLRVVRLKGGDPFVFGRGAEEAAALAEAGIDFECVPGVSSAIAAPAAAGIPLTARHHVSSFTVVTGQLASSSEDSVDWKAIVATAGTLVILMGAARLDQIAARLQDSGLAADTPVTAVTWATTPRQQVVRATLGSIGATSIQPPATIVVGALAACERYALEQP